MRRRAALVALACSPLLTRSMAGVQRDVRRSIELEALVQPGDLVFRVGTSPESIAVRSVSSHRFSHVGVAVSASPVRIVHATPADKDTAGGVVESTWSDFGIREDVETVHLYRVRALQTRERATVVGAAVALLGRPFDSQFLLDAPDGSLYCTVLVLRCLAGADLAIFELVKPQQVALLADPVYLPESLLQWERLEPVPPIQPRG